MKIEPEPSDEEIAAISASIGIYLAGSAEEEDAQFPEADTAPWVVAGRMAGANIAGGDNFKVKGSLWQASKFLGPLLVAATVFQASTAAIAAEEVAPSADISPSLIKLASKPDFRQTNSRMVKVLLASGTKLDLDFPDGAVVYAADGTQVGTFSAMSAWTIGGGNNLILTARGQGSFYNSQSTIKPVVYTPSSSFNYSLPLKPQNPDGDFKAVGGYVIVPGAPGNDSKIASSSDSDSRGVFAVGGKLYRGSLIIRPNFKGDKVLLSAINLIDIEDYLLSVVPSEVPSLWPQEVLKAQAIAARSYAAANLGKHKADGYDVKATVEDQVYRGVIAEADETNAAVAATDKLVLKHNDQVISAFFHSTSGGSTELAENVWGKALPYLKSVVDFDDASPAFNWKKTVSAGSLASSLGLSDPILGVLVVGRHPGESRRVKDVVVIGKSSARFVSGADLRRILSLPSTLFSLYQADDSYIFSGRGSGHGLGLSQWGAKALADNGYNAVQILSYYYKDVTIEPVSP